ncbi:MAG: baseplate assembly protein [Alphaproteobacteria bacterium]|nr:baseplate assembly protein [Alphaproteobacteria bacterium]MCB9794943.1 baseplate assembly protein [Alphaproteobacteria bacterium]
MNPVLGKHRAVVTDNDDPRRMGRVRVLCPSVLGDEPLWAMPCVPFAGDGLGWVSLPPVDARVWVEFEGGDPGRPIWVGGFWLEGQLPAAWAGPESHVLAAPGVTLCIDGEGLKLDLSAPATDQDMRVHCVGSTMVLELGGAKIELSATKVTVNDGGLEVS